MNSNKSRLIATILALAGIISLQSTAAGLVAAAPNPLPVQANDSARRITPDQVRVLLKENKAVVVDVRGKDVYDAGHIRGALSIPFAEVEARAKELPRDKTIVTYCS